MATTRSTPELFFSGETPLHRIVKEDRGTGEDIQKARAHLEDIQTHDTSGTLAISQVRTVAMMKLLLEELKTRQGLYHETNFGETILLTLILQDAPFEVIDYYLSHVEEEMIEFQAKATNLLQTSPLIAATISLSDDNNRDKLLKKLLELNADPNHRDLYGRTALMYAAEENDLNSITLLLKAKAKTNYQEDSRSGSTALGLVLVHGPTENQLAIIDALITQGAKITEITLENMQRFVWNIHPDDVQFVQKLLDKYPTLVPLYKAAIENSKIYESKHEALFKAAWEPNKAATVVPQANKAGNPIFLYACLSGDLEYARYLFNLGADPNLCKENGHSALHYAVFNRNLALLKFLINDTNINSLSINQNGSTPLDCARKMGLTEFVSILEKREALDRKRGKETEESVIFNNTLHMIKKAGHVMGLSDTITIQRPNGKKYAVETGGYDDYGSALILKEAVAKYRATLQKSGNTQIESYFDKTHHAIDLAVALTKQDNAVDTKTLLETYKRDQIIIVPCGWDFPDHTITITLYKENLVICDRGSGAFSATMVYQLPNRALITEDFLKSLRNPNSSMEEIFATLSDYAGIDFYNEFIQLPTKEQKHGTCSFVNFKSALIGILFLLKLEECKDPTIAQKFAEKQYKAFTGSMRDTFLDNLLKEYATLKSKDSKKTYLEVFALIIKEHHGQIKPNASHDRLDKRKQEIERLLKIFNGLDKESLDQLMGILKNKGVFLTMLGFTLNIPNLKTASAEVVLKRLKEIVVDLETQIKQRNKQAEKDKKTAAPTAPIVPQFKTNLEQKKKREETKPAATLPNSSSKLD